ncbi:MAG: M28 family metallopeptidase [Allosphingosinicella sp.]
MKFNQLLVGLAALSMSAAAPAQVSGTPPEFSPDAFRAHVAFLADDLLEGRESGTRGYDIAARYVAAQFAALGLRPGAGESWFQPIEFVRFTTGADSRFVVGGRSFAHGADIVMRPSPDSAPLSLEAPVVFAGYGLDLPARGYRDYDGLDVRGRIVVVLNGTPGGTPSDVAAHLNAEKLRMAAERGAIGLISIRSEAETERTPWTRYVRAAGRPATTWVDRDGQPFRANNLRFNAIVDRPVAEALFAGAPRTLAQARRAAVAGRPAGFDLGRSVRVERAATEPTRFASPNVVAVLPGTDPALAGEYVLLMAHLDGLGIREASEDGDRIRNGAMDNATGVATLIEVARQLSRPENRPRRPVLLAAVAAEEVGLLGSEYLARHPVGAGRVVSVVNLDMPILTYDFQDVIAFGAEHSTMGPIVERAAARMNVRLSPDPLPEQGLFTRSDHYEFVRVGVPSVFLMTGFAGEGEERFTEFLATEYHSAKDDLEQPFNWSAGARFAQLNYLIAREIANEPQAPLWYADSFFGETFGGTQRRAQRAVTDPDGGRRVR